MAADPRDVYLPRLDERRSVVEALTDRHNTLANGRLAMVGLAVLLGGLALGRSVSPGWLLVPAAGFGALAFVHDRVLARLDRARRAVEFYTRALARVEDRWQGIGAEGAAFLPDDHPFAADLDLFGNASLFQLISTARLGAGEQTLASWLLTPADRDEIFARQASVAELQPRLDLREQLAMVGEEVAGWLDTSQLARWGEQPIQLTGTWPRIVAAILAATNGATLLAAFVADASSVWFALSAAASLAFSGWYRRPVSSVLEAVNAPSHHLDLLAEVLAVLEHEQVTTPRLTAIREQISSDAGMASQTIHQLRRLVDILESRKNQVFAPISGVLLVGTQVAWAVESWRRRHGAQLARWIRAVGEFEALCSIAGYAFEHPRDPFAEIVSDCPIFEAEGLTHPLLPSATAVANDVQLDASTRVLVVSGSNMSGKSTLLRSVGVATVLALAGAPVRATRLRLCPLALGATLRIQDSLQAGRSRFFAEITRLRDIVVLTAGPRPVLFLLDELLAGTNSHDRRIGAAAIVRGLIARGAIGLLTTHDLALADVVGELGVHAVNVHFSDTFENGEMRFDYRMRPGVVRTSNALELMRSVGLLERERT
jgi:hypothetical protein